VRHTSQFLRGEDRSEGNCVGCTYTEADWSPAIFNEAAKLTGYVMSYESLRVLSERALRKWANERRLSFDLICVDWSLTLGPHMKAIGFIRDIQSRP
jgi:hypothetical protein